MESTIKEKVTYLTDYLNLLPECNWNELMYEHNRILNECNLYPTSVFNQMMIGINSQLESQMKFVSTLN